LRCCAGEAVCENSKRVTMTPKGFLHFMFITPDSFVAVC
jgi:hypothetical protein